MKKKAAWIRLAVLVLALVNQGLVMSGYSPIPIDNETLEQLVSLLFVAGAALISSWKDNDITKKAKLRKELGEKELKKLEDKQK